MEIKGMHFLITGANRGIGRAMTEMASREGAHLHLAVRTIDPSFESKLSSLGAASVKTWKADLSSRSGVESLLQQLRDQPIDILFNNAGQLTGGQLEKQTLDEIYSMFQVNLLALVQLTHGLLPGMIQRGRGKIINNASVSSYMHFPCATTYSASKAAVAAFGSCLEAELSGTGVSTLTLITPGIKTRMFDEIEVKYGGNMDVPQEHISPEEYADEVRAAILDDRSVYSPGGLTGFGLFIARHFPSAFAAAVKSRFRRI